MPRSTSQPTRARRNPFTPTAGATPPLLVGRGEVIDDFRESVIDGPGAPGLLTLVTGPRGTGKTVMLNALEDVARTEGWLHLSETATPGLLDRLSRGVEKQLASVTGDDRQVPRVTGASTPAGGVDIEYPDRPESGLRNAVTRLLGLLDERGAGLVVTVDEVHGGDHDELRHLGALAQHLVREQLPFALVLAGLPGAISDLLNDAVLTFLRRAERVELGNVADAEVRDALLGPIEDSGVAIAPEALDAAVAATEGYPFMIQLVGYNVWRSAVDGYIGLAQVAIGTERARRRLGNLVHATSLHDLSEVDKTFLVKMAKDDGPSRTGDIAERMGVKKNYVSVYRQRLLDAGVIRAVGAGQVEFTLPGLRDYLRDHAATLVRSPDA
ncbi:AAA family ATPase [uncultured Corynebacterium sp.]|uniref:AAA family ATPase n=1 Tax=uncultured Corynebacterium sp. TaxID=159447 RepID=UPI0025E9DA6D|nr:AAA family ATPase [uncultured Corynebacterium sp.]